MYKFIVIVLVLSLFTSCASLNRKHPGIGRVKQYEFVHPDVPEAFDGFQVAFISDLHYKSRFNEKALNSLVNTLNKLKPDVLLMGGDYQNGCEHVPELFAQLSRIHTPYGTMAIMGNHETSSCYKEVAGEMEKYGIRLLEHRLDTIRRKDSEIIIAGVRDPFNLTENGLSPTLGLAPDDFVIMLVHTPDYTEDVAVTNTDLALAGHTHGGQITFFGLSAPVTNSHYGQRFRTGLNHNSENIPVITTNGLGTSRKNIRLFAPSEIVIITLRAQGKYK